MAPRHEPHALAKERLADLIAQELEKARKDGSFDDLVIVALPQNLNVIRSGLNTYTETRLIGMLPKDLVKTPDHELGAHLTEWVRPVRRGSS